jgi:hypothetical protein
VIRSVDRMYDYFEKIGMWDYLKSTDLYGNGDAKDA